MIIVENAESAWVIIIFMVCVSAILCSWEPWK